MTVRLRGRDRLWLSRYKTLKRDGFSDEEAEWAADGRLKLGSDLVRLVRSYRKRFIRDFLYTFRGSTREGAIAQAAKQLRDRNLRFGLTGADVHNIFREVSI